MKEAKKELNFVYALAEHCNLNCAGCDHFAPLAKPEFSDFDEYVRDISRLSELFEGVCSRIALMGGEPLLCPEIERYLEVTRRLFADAQICIVTNGLLLGKMSERFFDSCAEYNIEIEYTKYPINYDYDAVHKRIEDKGIKINAYANTGHVQKTLYFIPIDLSGAQDPETNFDNCFHGNNCIQLKHGKLYTCTIIPNIEHFNHSFNTSIIPSEHDYIDIYDEDIDADKIFDFLRNPVPFCRYCNVKGRKENIPWHQSERDMKEWVERKEI